MIRGRRHHDSLEELFHFTKHWEIKVKVIRYNFFTFDFGFKIFRDLTKPGTFLKRRQRIFLNYLETSSTLRLTVTLPLGTLSRGWWRGGGKGVVWGWGICWVVRTTEKILATPLIKARFIRITQLALNLEKRDAEEFGGSYRAINKDFTFTWHSSENIDNISRKKK